MQDKDRVPNLMDETQAQNMAGAVKQGVMQNKKVPTQKPVAKPLHAQTTDRR